MQGTLFIIKDNEWLVCMYQSIFQTMDCRVAPSSTTRDAMRLLSGYQDRPHHHRRSASRRFRNRCDTGDPASARGGQPARRLQVSRLSALDEKALQSACYASVVIKLLDVGAFLALVRRYVGNRSPTAARAVIGCDELP